MRRYDAVLFDLGNTLVGYYQLPEFPVILNAGIECVTTLLRSRGHSRPPSSLLAERVAAENHESSDYCVRPLGARLQRIFGQETASDELTLAMCRAFMQPIFACAHLYDDSLPALQSLRSSGIRSAIVSNSPWGSPTSLWIEELDRLGIAPLIDVSVFCGDVGWRKPDRRIFDYALQQLGVTVSRCLFIGDDPRWDIVGPQAIGMDTVLIDRMSEKTDEGSIRTLADLSQMVNG